MFGCSHILTKLRCSTVKHFAGKTCCKTFFFSLLLSPFLLKSKPLPQLEWEFLCQYKSWNFFASLGLIAPLCLRLFGLCDRLERPLIYVPPPPLLSCKTQIGIFFILCLAALVFGVSFEKRGDLCLCSLEIDLVLISPQLGSFVSLMGGFPADQTIVISVNKSPDHHGQ